MTTEDQPIEVADRLAEWDISLDPEISYRLETLFPKLEGFGAKKAARRKAAVVREIEPMLRGMLQPREEVAYVAKGVQYSLAEHYFMGIWAISINHTVFVLTNLRLIMLRTNRKGRPKETFWMIFYSQITKFRGSWTGTFNVKLRDGKKLNFTGFPKLDRKQMGQVFESLLHRYQEAGFDPEVTQSMETLCTYCYERVPKREYVCEECHAEFWKPKEVALRSFVFPSWGDFVLKHYLVAGVELLGYGFTWLILLFIVLGGLANGELVPALITAIVLLLVVHAMDAGITYYVAKKGLHPRRGPQRRPAPRDVAMEV